MVGVSGRDSGHSKVVSHLRSIREGCLCVRGAAQGAEVDAAVSGEGETGGLQVRLLWEEEDQRARLSFIGGGDVEVEDRRDGGADLTVE